MRIVGRIPVLALEIGYRTMKSSRVNKSVIIEESSPPEKKVKSTAKPQKVDLKNIIEVTQENEPNPPSSPEDCKDAPQETPPSKLCCLMRYAHYLRNIWRWMSSSSGKLELDINDSDFVEVIAKIKSKKNYTAVLPAQKDNKKVLVLDLDQTLIHTTFTKPPKYDFESEVVFNGRNTKIFTVKRFGLDAFLFEMSKLYEIIVFTASQKLYADKVLDLIDPKRRITHRLYRDHCIVINKSYYLKNMRILGRNLSQVVVVDDNNIAGLLQPDNFYKIEPYEGNEKDRFLCRLSAFLKHIHPINDILPIREQRKLFEDIEINLSEEDTQAIKTDGRSLKDRKKQYKHKKTNSEVESLVTKTDEERDQAETTASELIKGL